LDTKPDMLASSPGQSHVCGFAAERGYSKFLTRLKFLESQLREYKVGWYPSTSYACLGEPGGEGLAAGLQKIKLQ